MYQELTYPAALSSASAAWLSVCFTLLYVLPFYLSATTRPTPALSRDAPSVIRARMRAVALSCAASTAITVALLRTHAHASAAQIAHLLGVWPISLADIAKSLLLVTILFAGPLFEAGVVEGEWRDWIAGRSVRRALSTAIGFRNLVFGPLTEELVFRALLLPLHLISSPSSPSSPSFPSSSPPSPHSLIALTPLYFGIAHIHHLYEYTLTHPHTPFAPALARSLFQFAYTSLFGSVAAFLYLRTASLPAVVLVHGFCNGMGLPRVWGRVEAVGGAGAGVRAQGGRDGGREGVGMGGVQVADGRLGVGWTVAYYLFLVAGAVGFWRLLWPLTESAAALVDLSV